MSTTLNCSKTLWFTRWLNRCFIYMECKMKCKLNWPLPLEAFQKRGTKPGSLKNIPYLMSSVADDTIRIKDIVMITPDTPATKKRNVNKLNIPVSHTVHLQRKKNIKFLGRSWVHSEKNNNYYCFKIDAIDDKKWVYSPTLIYDLNTTKSSVARKDYLTVE